MNAFRKRGFKPYNPSGSSPLMSVVTTKTVSTEKCPEPTTYVSVEAKKVSDYSASLLMPSDDEYQLRDMLASGNVPQQVNVSGMLDSSDELDLSNAGVGDTIFSRLQSEVKEPEPAPAAQPGTVPQNGDPEPANN